MSGAAGRPVVLALLGPTGSGKSALALQLAERAPIEIVSVDSAQVYRGMDIGTAKPSAAEQAAVRHHLIDLREPEAVYSAGEFRRDALAAIADIHSRGRIPVLVGGTMLYFRALFRGIAELPPADPALRSALDARAAVEGWPALHAELAVRDPAAGARIHPHDAQRIQRALELLAQGVGSLDAAWRAEATDAAQAIDWRVFVLEPADRAALHQRLADRLEAMHALGFVEEVRRLAARGSLTADSPSMRAVGYRQLLAYCEGLESLESARDKALFATRQLAKRQLTWLRSDGLLPPDAPVMRIDPLIDGAAERFMNAALQSIA
jgi:tRNA dimethylallyltransferase